MSDTEHATVSKKDKNERIDGGQIKGWTDVWKDGEWLAGMGMDGRMGDGWMDGMGMDGRKDDG